MKTTIERRWSLWQRLLIKSLFGLCCLLLIVFLAIWVVFPLVFMNSLSIQSFFMFMNTQDPKNPEFNNPEKYGIEGVINFYITTKDIDNSTSVRIGAWVVLPETEINTTNYKAHNDSSNAAYVMKNTAYPILLYLHGVACNRISSVSKYKIARKSFMVIAVDHRGYGDSCSGLELSELGIVSDTAQIYKWIGSHTKNEIFVWGHSLGAALGTHAIKVLKEDGTIIPTGLILESAFTTMREEVANSGIGKLFKWLLYFEQTVLEPLERNGFIFNTSNNILSVDCPIMIMHAEDDNVVPCFMGRKLNEIAQTQRDIATKGKVTYYEFPALLGYSHNGITEDTNITKYIEIFKAQCQEQNKVAA
ncbi:unnamed protein product [Phaedon cochleariae]|uniref:Serine aminopeptidase S33 domain-containing protein n=1 Tax=Phaedon cochleariae TaxID=80249 RepID=A0A9P0DJT8_PHACE|nr:unnamed protein product [Phaedon cochleariae]